MINVIIVILFIAFLTLIAYTIYINNSKKCPRCGKRKFTISSDISKEYKCKKCGTKFTFYDPYDY